MTWIPTLGCVQTRRSCGTCPARCLVSRARSRSRGSCATGRSTNDFGLWAVEIREIEAFIGFVGLQYSEDWPEGEHKAEVGWRLDRSYWGRGLATEGALTRLRCGFGKLGLERIISITLPENLASRRVMEKSGMAFRGETRWRGFDVDWYDVGREEWASY